MKDQMINQIVHGDCFEIMKTMNDCSVDMVLTDIPYLISKKQNFKNLKNYQTKNNDSSYNCMDFGEWDKEFDVIEYVKECYRILKPSKSIVVWCAWQQLHIVEEAMKSFVKGTDYGGRRIGIWEKTNPSVFNMQRMAIQPFEFFVWFRKGNNWTFNNQNGTRHDGKLERQLPERHYFKHGCIQGGHPTSKPTEIFEHLIRTYSNRSDIIFDGCCGGGTTAEAAQNTERNFFCIEKELEWVEYSRKRVSKLQQIINF